MGYGIRSGDGRLEVRVDIGLGESMNVSCVGWINIELTNYSWNQEPDLAGGFGALGRLGLGRV